MWRSVWASRPSTGSPAMSVERISCGPLETTGGPWGEICHGRGASAFDPGAGVRPAGGRAPDDQGFCALGAGPRSCWWKAWKPFARRARCRTGSRAPSCGCRSTRRSAATATVVCSQALMALADTAMVIACSAAWNGYRPMSTIDQTTHFLRPVNFDVVADARVVRIGRNTSFGRVMLLSAPTSGRSAWWRAPIRCRDRRFPLPRP